MERIYVGLLVKQEVTNLLVEKYSDLKNRYCFVLNDLFVLVEFPYLEVIEKIAMTNLVAYATNVFQ